MVTDEGASISRSPHASAAALVLLLPLIRIVMTDGATTMRPPDLRTKSAVMQPQKSVESVDQAQPASASLTSLMPGDLRVTLTLPFAMRDCI